MPRSGRIVGAQRYPGGAVTGDRCRFLNSVGSLELGVGLETQNTAAAILPCPRQEVGERWQALQRG